LAAPRRVSSDSLRSDEHPRDDRDRAAGRGRAAIGYCVFALGLYHTFQTTSYDLVIFDQAVRSYAHLHPGISVVKGVHNFFGPNFSILGDHWSPILASLAPLYWIYNGPVTLLVAQAVLFALAIPPLWVFTRRRRAEGARIRLPRLFGVRAELAARLGTGL
jgi:hypothetical protein